MLKVVTNSFSLSFSLLLSFSVESNNGKAMPSSYEGDHTKKQCPCYCTQPKTKSRSCRG